MYRKYIFCRLGVSLMFYVCSCDFKNDYLKCCVVSLSPLHATTFEVHNDDKNDENLFFVCFDRCVLFPLNQLT